jgi:hypothetical protein
VFLSSLAHVGRFRHFVPSTFVYFHFDFGYSEFWSLLAKVSIKSLCGDFGDISRLRKLNPKVGYDLELFGEISSIDLD